MRLNRGIVLAAAASAVMLLAACGGGGDGGDSNPGGLTPEQAGERVDALLTAAGCDTTERYSSIEAKAGKWELRAGIGLVSFVWTYDPAADTVTEASGRCTAN